MVKSREPDPSDRRIEFLQAEVTRLQELYADKIGMDAARADRARDLMEHMRAQIAEHAEKDQTLADMEARQRETLAKMSVLSKDVNSLTRETDVIGKRLHDMTMRSDAVMTDMTSLVESVRVLRTRTEDLHLNHSLTAASFDDHKTTERDKRSNRMAIWAIVLTALSVIGAFWQSVFNSGKP